MNPSLFKRFAALCARLSPENLCCDGECSPTETRRRHAVIMREWKELEREAGRKVTEEEVEREMYSARFATKLTDEQREQEMRANE